MQPIASARAWLRGHPAFARPCGRSSVAASAASSARHRPARQPPAQHHRQLRGHAPVANAGTDQQHVRHRPVVEQLAPSEGEARPRLAQMQARIAASVDRRAGPKRRKGQTPPPAAPARSSSRTTAAAGRLEDPARSRLEQVIQAMLTVITVIGLPEDERQACGQGAGNAASTLCGEASLLSHRAQRRYSNRPSSAQAKTSGQSHGRSRQ